MNIEAFALSLPKAPEMITLDPASTEAHGGASINDAEMKPFQVDMLPYLQQTRGDVIALYLNEEFVDDETVIDGQSTTSVFIRPGMFQKGLNRIRFRVTRTSGNQEDTKELILLHRTSPPGDTPPVMTLTVSHSSIGPDEANKVSVTVTYKNTQWYDRIFVDCNGVRLQHHLVPDSTTPLPPVPQNIVIPIPRTVLEQGGDDSDFEFRFRVVDYLTNPSGPPTWSDSVSVDVHLDRLSLPMAVLREIPTDNSDDPAIVDLAKMNGGPLWALVHLTETVWKPGDSIRLSFVAERNGAVAATHDQTLPVTQVATQLAWDIPNAKVVAGSQVSVEYQLLRGGNVIARSRPATATVTGAGSVELLPPFLVAPAVSPIDVLAYANGVTMRIEYLGALDGDRARLVEVNAPAGAPQFPLVAFNSNKRVNVVLTPAFLAARHGQAIEFRWNLNRGGGQAAKSPVLKVNVAKIVDGDVRLPVPNINGELGAELDIDKLPVGANIRIARWMFQERGMPVFLKLDGIDKDGKTVQKIIFNGEELGSADGLTVPAPIEWLNTLKTDSELSISFATSTDGTIDSTTAVLAPKRIYRTKLIPKIISENFDLCNDTDLYTGQKTELSTMTITCMRQSHGLPVRIMTCPPAVVRPRRIDGKILFLGDPANDARIRIDLKFACSKVTFWCLGGGFSIFYFNSSNDLIDKIIVPITNSLSLEEFMGKDIKIIEFQIGDNSANLDYFTFTT